MYEFLIFLYVLICVALIVSILLQSSKGGGLAGAFGGGGEMGAVFGGRGAATFLSRTTTILATSFMVFSLVLSLMGKSSTEGSTLVGQEQERRAETAASNLPVAPDGGMQNLLPVQPQSIPVTAPDSSK